MWLLLLLVLFSPAWARQELLLPTEKTKENLINHKELKRTGSAK